MADSDQQRNLAAFPIGTVCKMTGLSARQIRYYEAEGLVKPKRTPGGQRLFTWQDIELLQEAKKLMSQGLNLAGIKKILVKPQAHVENEEIKDTVAFPDPDVLITREAVFRQLPLKGRTSSLYPLRYHPSLLQRKH